MKGLIRRVTCVATTKHLPFHLKQKKSFVKYQKVLKYYDHHFNISCIIYGQLLLLKIKVRNTCRKYSQKMKTAGSSSLLIHSFSDVLRG